MPGYRAGDNQPLRVAVLRALQLGDLLCAVPALRSLRAALPQAEITLIGLGWAKSFAARFQRYLDKFLELPGYPGLPEETPRLRQLPTFLAIAQQRRFDLAIQMHGSGAITNPLLALFDARASAGFYLPGHYCPDARNFLPYPEGEHEVHRLLRLTEFLGFAPRGEELEFPLSGRDEEELLGIDEARELLAHEFVCLHPGARSNNRRWAPEKFAAVADRIAARGLRVGLTGAREESDLVAAVAAAMRARAVNLAGRTSLGALALLLKHARLLICNDTGVSHLAAALAVPSVVLFTGSDPQRWAPLNQRIHRVVANANHKAPQAVSDEAEALLLGEAIHVT